MATQGRRASGHGEAAPGRRDQVAPTLAVEPARLSTAEPGTRRSAVAPGRHVSLVVVALMASTSYERLIIGDLRRGRNGTDPPFSLQDQECVEALNVDYYNATLARKRGGADALSLTFSAGGP